MFWTRGCLQQRSLSFVLRKLKSMHVHTRTFRCYGIFRLMRTAQASQSSIIQITIIMQIICQWNVEVYLGDQSCKLSLMRYALARNQCNQYLLNTQFILRFMARKKGKLHTNAEAVCTSLSERHPSCLHINCKQYAVMLVI